MVNGCFAMIKECVVRNATGKDISIKLCFEFESRRFQSFFHHTWMDRVPLGMGCVNQQNFGDL